MKFKESLRHIPVGGTSAGGKLIRSEWRHGCACGTTTDWHHIYGEGIPDVPCCSDECFDRQIDALLDEQRRIDTELKNAPVLLKEISNEQEQGNESSHRR